MFGRFESDDPTSGQALVWYEGTGTAATDRRYLSADERGSIISVSDRTGASLGVNSYDEFGNPAATNLGRFGYTGQAWLPSAKLWYYKARVYHPGLGRFLQPDPIGYAGDGPNLYAYVLNDPINFIDPLGLAECTSDENIQTEVSKDGSGGDAGCDIIVTGVRIPKALPPLVQGQPPGPGGPAKPKQPKPNPKPAYCASIVYKIAEKSQEFGEDLSNFASGVVAAGLIGKSPHVIGAGETVGAVGLTFQSVGTLGKFAISGNTSMAALDAAGIVASFMKTQTQAAQLVSGHVMGAAISGAQDAGKMDPCK